MGNTSIEWTATVNPDGTTAKGKVWNPVTGCEKVSPGCKNCYAERIAERFWGDRKFTDVVCHADRLEDPLKWRKPVRVFVNSMSDLFHQDVPFEFIDKVLAVMGRSQHHSFMVITKRPARMVEYFQSEDLYHRILQEAFKLDGKCLISNQAIGQGISDPTRLPLPNVWLGVSAEDQKTADERIPLLLQTPAAVRFVSCEPLLGPVDLTKINVGNGDLGDCLNHKIDRIWTEPPRNENWGKLHWVICGGESGPGARPMHSDWARSLRDQCQAADVPFFFKQWGEWMPFSHITPENAENYYQGQNGQHVTVNDLMGHAHEILMHEGTIRIGKKRAGRLLDNREWSEFPERISV